MSSPTVAVSDTALPRAPMVVSRPGLLSWRTRLLVAASMSNCIVAVGVALRSGPLLKLLV